MIVRQVPRWLPGALVVALLGLAGEQLWRHGHDYVFEEQFRVVEPGRIYRGAWQKPWPMRRIVKDYKIKTVLALAHPAEHRLPLQEKVLAGELGVRWIHIPIVDLRGTGDHAAEEAISDLLDQAAAVVADPKNYPLFFHCHHGFNRTSMVQIAYRTKYCGWTLEQAMAEIERMVGPMKQVRHGPDYRHMVSYYQSRVLPLRKQPEPNGRSKGQDLTASVARPLESSDHH
jgi:protein-tyrosine phosphatase